MIGQKIVRSEKTGLHCGRGMAQNPCMRLPVQTAPKAGNGTDSPKPTAEPCLPPGPLTPQEIELLRQDSLRSAEHGRAFARAHRAELFKNA